MSRPGKWPEWATYTGPVGAVIETDESRLRNEAQAAQRVLFADPTNLSLKRAYGYALASWAKEKGSVKAAAFARTLIEATE